MKIKKTCPHCFRSISEGTRVKIIQHLKGGPNNVSNIESHFSLTQPTISYHLKVLEKMGMISSEKKGREIFYFLNNDYPCKNCAILKIPLKV